MSGVIFAQTLISGMALGAAYSLVALGFVIVFAATRTMNFAQGAFVLIGAYATYQFGSVMRLGFVPGLVISIVITALVAVIAQRLVMYRFAHKTGFSGILVTIGVLYILQSIVTTIWGVNAFNLGDPWGVRILQLGSVTIPVASVWRIIISVILIVGTFAFLRYTRGGLAMRATASDSEAAVSVGVRPRRVTYYAWAAAGALGAVAGTLLATGSGGVSLGLTNIVFAAMPAIVLGGLDSPIGAIVGGFVIGIVQQFSALVPVHIPSLGSEFSTVTPFIVLLIVLLVRPHGIFGTRAVERF